MEKKRFNNFGSKRFRTDKKTKGKFLGKNKDEKKKNEKLLVESKSESKKEKKKKKEVQTPKVYKPSFVVYEWFDLPKGIESYYFADKAIKYRRPDGKVSYFPKGNLIMNHGDGIVSVLDGRYGRIIS